MRTARVGSAEYPYQVNVPNDIGPSPPIIIFLHGIGQRGAGGFLPRSGAANALVRRYLSRVPALILLPQCSAGVYWSNPVMDEMVATALAQTEAEFNADSARLYLTGVSMVAMASGASPRGAPAVSPPSSQSAAGARCHLAPASDSRASRSRSARRRYGFSTARTIPSSR